MDCGLMNATCAECVWSSEVTRWIQISCYSCGCNWVNSGTSFFVNELTWPYATYLLGYCEIQSWKWREYVRTLNLLRVTRWHSGEGAVLQIGRSLVRSQLVSLEFFIDMKSFRSQYGIEVDSASNRNETPGMATWTAKWQDFRDLSFSHRCCSWFRTFGLLRRVDW